MGNSPLIKKIFEEEYVRVWEEENGEKPNHQQVHASQGYYFARTGKGDLTDDRNSMSKNSEVFDLILRDKKRLLTIENPVEFIFSHSALGVGWDNPNVFNIATLNETYSEIKKRQEIGRGLRICVDQLGNRIYDPDSDDAEDEINLLTVIPNETYETFAIQYQSQIKEDYGDDETGQSLRKNLKGKKNQNTLRRNDNHFNGKSFRTFWKSLSKKTEFTVSFDEGEIIKKGIVELGKIKIPEYEADISLTRITRLEDIQSNAELIGQESEKLSPKFSPIDFVEEISENTSISTRIVLRIIKELNNKIEIVRNPPLFVHHASKLLKRIELEEMLRTLSYVETGDSFSLSRFKKSIKTWSPVEPTPNKGIYDHVICDSDSQPEHNFSRNADCDPKVVCLFKLPDFYKIQTPIGKYQPDFGLVVKVGGLKNDTKAEVQLVVETKSTKDIEDLGKLTESERIKIKCAIKHFQALGFRTLLGDGVQYENSESEVSEEQGCKGIFQAPVKDYSDLEPK